MTLGQSGFNIKMKGEKVRYKTMIKRFNIIVLYMALAVFPLPSIGIAQSKEAEKVQQFLNHMQIMMQQMNQQKQPQQVPTPQPTPVPQHTDQSGAMPYMSSSLKNLHVQVHTRVPHSSARMFADTKQRFPATYAVLLGIGMQKQMQMLNQRGGSMAQFNALEQEIIRELHGLARYNGNRNPQDGSPLNGTRLEKDYLGARMGYHNSTMMKHGIDVNALTMDYVISTGTSQAYAGSGQPKPIESRPVTSFDPAPTGKPVPTQRPVEGRPISAGEYQYQPLELPDVEDF